MITAKARLVRAFAFPVAMTTLSGVKLGCQMRAKDRSMPVDDLAEGVFRFFARMCVELVVECLIQGTGHVVLRTLRPRSTPSETAATLTGLGIWALLIATVLWLWHASSR